MLVGINSIITPEVYKVLFNMGHGDQLVIVDNNFPADSLASRHVHLLTDTTQLFREVLKYISIDKYVNNPIQLMKIIDGDLYEPEAWSDYMTELDRNGYSKNKIEYLERSSFYNAAKSAYAIISTDDHRRYANVIITKGIIERVAR